MAEDVLTEETFRRNVKTKFQVASGESREVELELTDVVSYNPNPGDQTGLERFSAFFEGPADAFLEQNTYTFEHEGLDPFPLFITPIGKNERGFRYEAVVNRKKDGE